MRTVERMKENGQRVLREQGVPDSEQRCETRRSLFELRLRAPTTWRWLMKCDGFLAQTGLPHPSVRPHESAERASGSWIVLLIPPRPLTRSANIRPTSQFSCSFYSVRAGRVALVPQPFSETGADARSVARKHRSTICTCTSSPCRSRSPARSSTDLRSRPRSSGDRNARLEMRPRRHRVGKS